MKPPRESNASPRRSLAGLLAGAALASLVTLCAAAAARAHDTSFSHADVDWQRERVEICVSVHRDDAASALGVAAPESLMRAPFLARETARLAARLERGLHVRADGVELPLALEDAAARPDGRTIALRFAARLSRPAGRLGIEARLFPADPLHETYVNVRAAGRLVRQGVLSAERPAIELYDRGAAGTIAAVGTFVRSGIHHIFIGPDHVLFIVGLLLLGGGLARVLRVATAFTLAHSITLALAATGCFVVPGRWVEPLIALSIVCVGLENLRARPGAPDRRTRLAFGFGLVHGLGFASVLREVGLPREALASSLVGFNLGVELGQASIVLAMTPLLGLLRATLPRTALRVVAAGSWAIILAGGYWFFVRVLARA